MMIRPFSFQEDKHVRLYRTTNDAQFAKTGERQSGNRLHK